MQTQRDKFPNWPRVVTVVIDEFVHPFEDEFVSFYDEFFNNFVRDDEILCLEKKVPISLSSLIYGILTTDNLNGFKSRLMKCFIEENGLVIYGASFADCQLYMGKLDIKDSYNRG